MVHRQQLAIAWVGNRRTEIRAYEGVVQCMESVVSLVSSSSAPAARRDKVLVQSPQDGTTREFELAGHDVMMTIGSRLVVFFALEEDGQSYPVLVENRDTGRVSKLRGARVAAWRSYGPAAALLLIVSLECWRRLGSESGWTWLCATLLGLSVMLGMSGALELRSALIDAFGKFHAEEVAPQAR